MSERRFAFLHFLNQPGHMGALTGPDNGSYEWVESVEEAVAEMTTREKSGTWRFVEINHFVDRDVQPSFQCVVHEGAYGRLYPLTRESRYQHPNHRGLDSEHPLYVLKHTANGVAVEDLSMDYVCVGCYGDIRYETAEFVHADDGSELCEYSSYRGDLCDGRPGKRSTAEWACQRKSYKLHPYPRPIPVRPEDGLMDVEAFRRECENAGVWKS